LSPWTGIAQRPPANGFPVWISPDPPAGAFPLGWLGDRLCAYVALPVGADVNDLSLSAATSISEVAVPVVRVHAASIAPEEAAAHVGETTTVCGLVVSTTYLPQAPQSPTFLDLGKPYPNQVFSAIIFGEDRPKFGAPETSMRDKTVCLTGEIFLYEGKPKIILHDPKELSGG